jgi:hypothetical protein
LRITHNGATDCRPSRNLLPMKLAPYRDGSRDGQLVVVSRDLSRAHFATGIATRMPSLLDDWNFLSPQLEASGGDGASLFGAIAQQVVATGGPGACGSA